jgi:hypothetical protein
MAIFNQIYQMGKGKIINLSTLTLLAIMLKRLAVKIGKLLSFFF